MNQPAAGFVAAVRNHGTIVEVILDTGVPIYFDHTPFRHLIEAEGDIRGRYVTFDGEALDIDNEPYDEDPADDAYEASIQRYERDRKE